MFKARAWPLLMVMGFSCVAHGQLDFATYLDRSSANGLWAGAYNFNNDGVGDQAFRSQQSQPAMRLGPHGTEQTIFTYLNSLRANWPCGPEWFPGFHGDEWSGVTVRSVA